MNKPKVIEISPTLFEVMNYSVKLQKRNGRLLLLCSCQNHARFCKENPFCYHKQLVIEYINLKKIRKEIDKLLNFYKEQVEIKSQFDAEVFLDDLNNLKKVCN